MVAKFVSVSEWPIFQCDSPKCNFKFTVGLIWCHMQDIGEEGYGVNIPGEQGQGMFYCPWCGTKTKKNLT